MTDPIQPQLVQGGDDDPWFLWARSNGRFTGLPVGSKGILLIVGAIAGDVLLGLLAAFAWQSTGQLFWFIGYFFIGFPMIFVIIFGTIRAKGREVPVPDGPEPVNTRMNRALTEAMRLYRGDNT